MARRKVPIRQSELVHRFAERLREARQSRGMTQADLSRLAHVTVSYVSRLESAKIAPGIDMVERLAAALATDVSDLLSQPIAADPLPVLKEQADRMVATLLEKGDRDTFMRLNPILALFVESTKHRYR